MNLEAMIYAMSVTATLSIFMYTTLFQTSSRVNFNLAKHGKTCMITSDDIKSYGLTDLQLWVVFLILGFGLSSSLRVILTSDVYGPTAIFLTLLNAISFANLWTISRGILHRLLQGVIWVCGLLIYILVSKSELPSGDVTGFIIAISVAMAIPACCAFPDVKNGALSYAIVPACVIISIMLLYSFSVPFIWGSGYGDELATNLIVLIILLANSVGLTNWASASYLKYGGNWKSLYYGFFIANIVYALMMLKHLYLGQ